MDPNIDDFSDGWVDVPAVTPRMDMDYVVKGFGNHWIRRGFSIKATPDVGSTVWGRLNGEVGYIKHSSPDDADKAAYDEFLVLAVVFYPSETGTEQDKAIGCVILDQVLEDLPW